MSKSLPHGPCLSGNFCGYFTTYLSYHSVNVSFKPFHQLGVSISVITTCQTQILVLRGSQSAAIIVLSNETCENLALKMLKVPHEELWIFSNCYQ